MSRQRVQACDGEGTGWDDSPGKGGREGKKRHWPLGGWRGSCIPLRDRLRAVAAGKRGTGFAGPGGASLPREGTMAAEKPGAYVRMPPLLRQHRGSPAIASG